MVGPPMLTICGRSNLLSPSSAATEQPMFGCLIVADGHVAGVELVGRPLVVAFLVGHGPHQGDLFHDLGRLVPALSDRDPRDGRLDGLGLAAVLGAGLGVERLELAGPAGHPEQDAGHLPLPQLVGLEGHQSVKLSGIAAEARRRRTQADASAGNRGGRRPPRRSSPPARSPSRSWSFAFDQGWPWHRTSHFNAG